MNADPMTTKGLVWPPEREAAYRDLLRRLCSFDLPWSLPRGGAAENSIAGQGPAEGD